MVGLFNISGVYDISKGVTYCKDVHMIFSGECDCAFSSAEDVILALSIHFSVKRWMM